MLIRVRDSKVAIIPSFHSLPQGYSLASTITDAAGTAELVVFERDLDVALEWPKPPGPSLGSLHADVVPTNLQELWRGPAIRGNLADLDRLTPGEVANIVEARTSEHSFGLLFEAGVDWRIWQRVEQSKRKWIEASSAVLEAMHAYPPDEQLSDLVYACDLAKRREDFLAELKAWEIGDSAGLGALLDVIYQRTPMRANEMLRERNVAMLSEIMAELSNASRSSVFVLGAAHVLGEHGLIKDLQRAGLCVDVLS